MSEGPTQTPVAASQTPRKTTPVPSEEPPPYEGPAPTPASEQAHPPEKHIFKNLKLKDLKNLTVKDVKDMSKDAFTNTKHVAKGLNQLSKEGNTLPDIAYNYKYQDGQFVRKKKRGGSISGDEAGKNDDDDVKKADISSGDDVLPFNIATDPQPEPTPPALPPRRT
ncbi:hypothetical protein B0O99DRAFT_589699 [Bisporella sp. PMI_857]|nr:hypothetical protein B0O99DRAFT_589699 [Bisporella sp. PMI_857]